MSPSANIGSGCAAGLSNNGDLRPRPKNSICFLARLKEENIRFVLLAGFLIIYLVFGAFFFSYIEDEAETQIRDNFVNIYEQFVSNLTALIGNPSPLNGGSKSMNFSLQSDYIGIEISRRPFITLDNLHDLLYAYGNASKAGVIFQRRRWDFAGSFHFAWTIVSTIGYGATTPMTTLGKMLVIPYGFFGCAGGLLFFNLFLERIITFLASCMRMYRIQRQKRRPSVYGGNNTNEMWAGGPRRGSPGHSSAGNGSVVEEPNWKPSVYWVMLCLFIMSAIVISISAAMFQFMEGWSFIESVYFSFVSYATIGFGDFVSLQERNYGSFETIYRIGAFAIMVFGCCCIYSLLNVTSIVIKQSLNWLIKSMDYCEYCCCCCHRCSSAVRRFSTRRRRGRRGWYSGSGSVRSNFYNSTMARMQDSGSSSNPRSQRNVQTQQNNSSPTDTPNVGPIGFDYDERRFSGENMISIRGELNNKVSLAVMQKRLYETAQMSRTSLVYDSVSFSATSVGPLAIVTEKLGDNNHS